MASKKKAAKRPARKRLTKLVIDRERWGTGALKTTEGKMCCLGFAVTACGVRLKTPGERFFPFDLAPQEKRLFPLWLEAARADVLRLADINDKTGRFLDLSDEEQEKLIIEGFAKHGCKVTFVGRRTR